MTIIFLVAWFFLMLFLTKKSLAAQNNQQNSKNDNQSSNAQSNTHYSGKTQSKVSQTNNNKSNQNLLNSKYKSDSNDYSQPEFMTPRKTRSSSSFTFRFNKPSAEGDWLAQQRREERASMKRLYEEEGRTLRDEHHDSCDAELLRELHEDDCEAAEIRSKSRKNGRVKTETGKLSQAEMDAKKAEIRARMGK